MSDTHHFSARQIAILGLLSALWAIIEIELGFIFRSLHLPFFGVILTFSGFIILLISHEFVFRKGTLIFVALTTAFLKLVYLGAFSLLPVLAIISEGILLELFFWYRKRPGRTPFILAGLMLFTWTFCYPFFALGLLSGWEIQRIIQLIENWGQKLPGLSSVQGWQILTIVLGLHVLAGFLAGIFGWRIIVLARKFMQLTKIS